MHGLFGKIEISEQAHQRRQNPARFRPVKSLNGPAELFGPRGRHHAKLAKGVARQQLCGGFVYRNISSTMDLSL
jgi:hypothetical protein